MTVRSKQGWIARGALWSVPLILVSYLLVVVLNAAFPWMDDRTWGNLSLWVMTGQLVVFSTLYGLRSNWHLNEVGRMFLWHTTISSGVMFQVAMSAATASDYPYREYVRPVVYALGMCSWAAMTVMLMRYQAGRGGPAPRVCVCECGREVDTTE